jgi:cupin 2 domain-containing protein
VNVFDQIPESADQELFTTLLSARDLRIERIVSSGQKSPDGFWYDQEENEWVLILEGSATLGFGEGNSVALKKGDCLNIPARTRHRVEKTDENGKTVWLAIFYK